MSQSLQEHIDIINSLPERVSQLAVESIVVPAAEFMTASILQRNTNEGRNTDGSKRPAYSSKPTNATRQQFVVKSAFQPQGKKGNKTKKNGQPYRSMYLPGGYGQQRSIQGMPVDKMTYKYSGETEQAFDLQSAPQQGSVFIGFRTEKAARIRQALEKKNGRAYYPSADEIKAYTDEVTEQSQKLNIKLITGIS